VGDLRIVEHAQKRATLWRRVGAVQGALAVAMGAFGAHALADRLSARMLQVFETGARYHLVHAIALLSCSILLSLGYLRAQIAAALFAVGISIFSGSLYALALTDIKLFGAVTPIGGMTLIAGWLALLWVRRPHHSSV
jgi:uncharacterized membrane protein YgdD (TMEM256/DUF423 family)